MADKRSDLAGPGIGSYSDLEQVLPRGYDSLLTPRETQRAIFAVKQYIEESLCRELNLMMVTVPLIVGSDSGVNDMLDRDGSRTPDPVPRQQRPGRAPGRCADRAGRDQMEAGRAAAVRLRARRGHLHRHARRAQGLLPRPRPQLLCGSVGLGTGDHRRSAHPWIPERDRRQDLAGSGRRGTLRPADVPGAEGPALPGLPEELTFLHAEELLEMYPDLPRKQRETAVLQRYPAVFITGIGWPLDDGYPHEMRAADYDDWVTDTSSATGKTTHGLNGDILVWNHVTGRRHELTSMGIRVTAQTLQDQLARSGQLDMLQLPYHQGIVRGELPLSDRRRHRPGPHADAPAPQGASGRGKRVRVAEDPYGHVRGQEHPRTDLTPRRPARHATRRARSRSTARRRGRGWVTAAQTRRLHVPGAGEPGQPRPGGRRGPL